ncbi:MAG TPA: imidazole glycerol phosphate synthase cyclase subunit [Candidatus Peribacterales bacterium]|nr:imidazole glycerol phosphate synthase cyclase subunit [Candidatus Peribacterales bacterium]
MLKKRLIASLLWRSGQLIQSKNFRHTNAVGNAYTAVDFFNTWAIDEIVLLDVTREKTEEDRERFHRDLRELSKRCFVPLAVGGWLSTIDEMRQLLTEGADKIVLNTEAYRDGEIIEKGAKRFGKQCIVISIDARKANGRYEVVIDRGQEFTDTSPVEWAKTAEKLGAGEILLRSIDHDGTKQGYDLELVASVSAAVSIPVIAAGGAGEWEHFQQGIEAGALAVAAGNLFQHAEQSTKKVKNALFEHGIDVRRPEFYDIGTPRKIIYRVDS